MSSYQLDTRLSDVDKAMRLLRESMRGIPIRFAGFKKEHDRLARSVAGAAVLLECARPAFTNKQGKGKTKTP
ncbi:hypothetical protein ORV05_02050 [Amycolatopsis cynarae]|uniref:Transposase n=1 Tax=Amycolatopsis cynarae TaxID=2995223 RepID=A0ABY7B5V3_9PSEU|nr:hypothetical protein [Amycolatopsis sp. HUAS 11-8]WAL66622.1 hypothetical protein ORV05_02050 [Amycolatopsis sp. HUAS 11-8]